MAEFWKNETVNELEDIEIMQGDEYDVQLSIKTREGEKITENDVDTLEISLNSLRWSFPESVNFDPDTGYFSLRITQQQSFSLPPGKNVLQMRIKTLDGNVYGVYELNPVNIIGSISKVVL